MNKDNLSWWLSFLFSSLVSYCLWLWMSPGWNPEYLFPGTLFAAMLSFTAVFGATLHMQQYSDRFIAPVFLVLSVLFSLLFVVYVWGLAMVFYSQG
ncbi:hypothetical protein ITU92_002966 [Salmonella enterica]|nr:hypothetical protein [Salmonella enterica]